MFIKCFLFKNFFSFIISAVFYYFVLNWFDLFLMMENSYNNNSFFIYVLCNNFKEIKLRMFYL